jgi:hypothetical protein
MLVEEMTGITARIMSATRPCVRTWSTSIAPVRLSFPAG